MIIFAYAENGSGAVHGLPAEHVRRSDGDRFVGDARWGGSHDRFTRFLAQRDYTSKDLWRQVKSTVRKFEDAEGVLIFDDTIQEKAWID